MQITLEEVEVVFGSGAGARVRSALGQRRAIEGFDVESDGEPNGTNGADKVVTLEAIPKIARRHMSLVSENESDEQ